MSAGEEIQKPNSSQSNASLLAQEPKPVTVTRMEAHTEKLPIGEEVVA